MSATEIRGALQGGQFELAFQPKVTLSTGTLSGVEVLTRWGHPTLGTVPPSIFIPIAENGGLMEDLTNWMLGAALRQWGAWREIGLMLEMAVNISALSFEQLNFPDRIEAMCEEQAVPCAYLTIELTESATLQSARLMDAMTRLRLKGMKISLDDYGTGYSSLMQLHQLPFNEIKIDQSFVRDADTSRDSRIILKSIIDLAHNLEMTVTAEGVETTAVLELLTCLGCDQAQGYLVGLPMPSTDLLNWLDCRNRRPVAECFMKTTIMRNQSKN